MAERQADRTTTRRVQVVTGAVAQQPKATTSLARSRAAPPTARATSSRPAAMQRASRRQAKEGHAERRSLQRRPGAHTRVQIPRQLLAVLRYWRDPGGLSRPRTPFFREATRADNPQSSFSPPDFRAMRAGRLRYELDWAEIRGIERRPPRADTGPHTSAGGDSSRALSPPANGVRPMRAADRPGRALGSWARRLRPIALLRP